MTTASISPALVSGFLGSAERFPDRPALEVGGAPISYGRLLGRAAAIAGTLADRAADEPRLTAVFAARTPTAYAGVLGALLRGHGYVPLNPRYPAVRNRAILERSGCGAVVVDSDHVDAAAATLTGLGRRLSVLIADRSPTAADSRLLAPHETFGADGADDDVTSGGPDDPAYLLFTSGSTGRPKGVLVRRRNVRAFLDGVLARHELDEHDRLTQMFDLTFDLSVFDLFAAWERGACVCVPRAEDLIKPSDFVRSARPTVWFSVPSVAMLMQRFRVLKPDAFPSLRLSLFCGEALPTAAAAAWRAAAPASVVENLYGPTEATVACTAYRLDGSEAPGLVPIGMPFGETSVRVVDELLREVPAGEPGELVLSGPQVVDGYLDDEGATARAFATVPGLGPAYRTGDRVVADSDGSLSFLGRLDSQIKVLGHRVELEEVEAAIRDEAGSDAIAVGWPRTETGAAGIVALVGGAGVDVVGLRRRLAERLPDYMVPREIRVVAELPLNANGKRDRRAAAELLESS